LMMTVSHLADGGATGCLLIFSALLPQTSSPIALQIREELDFAITQPIANPQLFSAMGLQQGAGVLLYGPPGAQWRGAAAAGLGLPAMRPSVASGSLP
jgi:hypothetical protein